LFVGCCLLLCWLLFVLLLKKGTEGEQQGEVTVMSLEVDGCWAECLHLLAGLVVEDDVLTGERE